MTDPILIQELPEREMWHGPAMQLDNDDASAISIAKWLEGFGIVSWLLPQGKARNFQGTVLRVEGADHDNFHGSPGPAYLYPNDWVLIRQDGKPMVLHNVEYENRYKREDLT